MAILVNVVQDKREDSNHMWYGRGYYPETVDLKWIAKQVTEMCTVTEADALAVLTELVQVIDYELKASHVVKLDGFGYFRINPRTKGALRKEDFTIQDNVKGWRVKFQPTSNKNRGRYTNRSMGYGYKFKIFNLEPKTKKP